MKEKVKHAENPTNKSFGIVFFIFFLLVSIWPILKNGDLRGAALDVTNPEPISGYHELCSLKNCIIVPHIGTATSECRINMARIAAENICNHYELG